MAVCVQLLRAHYFKRFAVQLLDDPVVVSVIKPELIWQLESARDMTHQQVRQATHATCRHHEHVCAWQHVAGADAMHTNTWHRQRTSTPAIHNTALICITYYLLTPQRLINHFHLNSSSPSDKTDRLGSFCT
jgi:hypothetical protein